LHQQAGLLCAAWSALREAEGAEPSEARRGDRSERSADQAAQSGRACCCKQWGRKLHDNNDQGETYRSNAKRNPKP